MLLFLSRVPGTAGQRTFQLGALFAAGNCALTALGWSAYGKQWGLKQKADG